MSLPTNSSDIPLLETSIAAKRLALQKSIALKNSTGDAIKSQRGEIRSMVAMKESVCRTMANPSNVRIKDFLVKFFSQKMLENGTTSMDCKILSDSAIEAAYAQVRATIVISDDLGSDSDAGSDESEAERDEGAGERTVPARSATLTDSGNNVDQQPAVRTQILTRDELAAAEPSRARKM